MNKKLLAAALGVAFAAPVFADSSSLTLYGRLHTTVENNDVTPAGGTSNSETTMRNNSSRLGVNIKESLGGSLSFIGGYEFAVETDSNGGGSEPNTRNGYLGFAGSFGKVTFGTQDGGNGSVSPLYTQASAYVLNGQNNVGAFTQVGGGNSGNAAATSAIIQRQQRVNNSIAYANSFGGLKVAARTSSGDANPGQNATNNESDNRISEIALDYALAGVSVGVGYAKFDKGNGTAGSGYAEDDQFHIGVRGTVGPVTLAGFFGQTDFQTVNTNNLDKLTTYALSLDYKIGGGLGVTAAAIQGEWESNVAGVPDVDGDQYQIIGYYDFSKRTRAYLAYEDNQRDDNLAGQDAERQTFGVGLRHNF